MIFIPANQILACTVGMINEYKGIDFNQLEAFVTILKKHLSTTNLTENDVYVEYPSGDTIYYSDRWRKHFRFFQGKYYPKHSKYFEKEVAFHILQLKKQIPSYIVDKSINDFKDSLELL